MFPKASKKNLFRVTLILALSAVLAATIGTRAWLRYTRSLQTMTQVSIAQLLLKDSTGSDSLTIDLGEIDMSKEDNKRFVFGVQSQNADKYWIQLAHTTNLRLTYKIYPTDQPLNIPQNLGTPLAGQYLNRDEGTLIANRELHGDTYGTYGDDVGKVQINAEPLYWQYGPIAINQGDIQYYVLEISWLAMENNKETDVIYLMAGTTGKTNHTGGSQ